MKCGPILKYNRAMKNCPSLLCLPGVILAAALSAGGAASQGLPLDIPDTSLAVTYERAAVQNVLAAVNPEIFFGYFSVCADGHGFGHGNTYPSLDGHQMSDALLWLDRVRVVEANWDYVKSFQRNDGLLPLAILPASAGKDIGPKGFPGIVSANGGLYVHWVPGNPLEGLSSPTYIQNADVIYRRTLDTAWLLAQLPSVNHAADYLGSMTTEAGAVKGGGYYVERPPRLESDGVTQCYAVDAFRIAASLNRIAGNDSAGERYDRLGRRIQHHFVTEFWVGDHFAEYFNPAHGYVAGHGLTDVDWAAIAADVATPEQVAVLWPQIRSEERFHYGGIPAGLRRIRRSTKRGSSTSTGMISPPWDASGIWKPGPVPAWGMPWGSWRGFGRSARWGVTAVTTGTSDSSLTGREGRWQPVQIPTANILPTISGSCSDFCWGWICGWTGRWCWRRL
jgi:hypothetical protein